MCQERITCAGVHQLPLTLEKWSKKPSLRGSPHPSDRGPAVFTARSLFFSPDLLRSSAPSARALRVEWSPRPGASGFRAPGDGNWGASGDPPNSDSSRGKPQLVSIRYRRGSAWAVLGLLCDLCLPAGSRPRAQPVGFRGGGRGAGGFGEILLVGGEIVAAREEGGVLGPRSERAGGLGGGSAGVRGKGHVRGGSCRAAGIGLPRWLSDDESACQCRSPRVAG